MNHKQQTRDRYRDKVQASNYVRKTPENTKSTISSSSRKPPERKILIESTNLIKGKRFISSIKQKIAELNQSRRLYSYTTYPVKAEETGLGNERAEERRITKYKFKPESKINEIKSKEDGWIISVPLRRPDGKIEEIEMTADPGANTAGIGTEFAELAFPEWIQRTSRGIKLYTPSGCTIINDFVTLSFERADRCIWTSRFYLLPDLQVDLLADINVLRAFGCIMENGRPLAFQKIKFEKKEGEASDEPVGAVWGGGEAQGM